MKTTTLNNRLAKIYTGAKNAKHYQIVRDVIDGINKPPPPREIQTMRELLNDIEKYQNAGDASIADQLISILIAEADNYKTKLLKE